MIAEIKWSFRLLELIPQGGSGWPVGWMRPMEPPHLGPGAAPRTELTHKPPNQHCTQGLGCTLYLVLLWDLHHICAHPLPAWSRVAIVGPGTHAAHCTLSNQSEIYATHRGTSHQSRMDTICSIVLDRDEGGPHVHWI